MNILEYAKFKKMFGGSGGATAYHLTSVDELPADAVDGSLAVVTETQKVTKWVLNDEPDLSTLSMQGQAISFVCGTGERGKFIWRSTQGSSSWGIYGLAYELYDEYGNPMTPSVYTYNPSGNYGISHGWADENYKSLLIFEAGETAMAWVEANGTKTGEEIEITLSTTLYSRENGEWVKGEEIGGDSAEPNLIEQTFTANDTYEAKDEGADGYSKVVVNVPNVIPDGYIKPSGTLPITENGTHDVTEFASAKVEVPMPTIIEAPSEITENRTYTASEFGADGISKFTVNVASAEGDTLTEFLRWRNGQYLFARCTDTEVPSFNGSVLTNTSYMFDNCYKLTSVPLFDTSNVTEMSYMFQGCRVLTSVPLFDTSKVENMNRMFYSCTQLTSVPLFDTSKVTDMSYMFYSCTQLTSVPLFDTSKVTQMGNMFNNCTQLTSVPLFDTSKVENMSYMFYSCTALTSVPLFNTSKVENMSYMFNNCTQLTSVPLFDTSKVTQMGNMFYNCSALTSVPELDVRKATMSSMFYNCTNLTDCRIRNIKSNLQVGAGTSYGHLLTVDSLVHLIYELRKQSASRTLTVGTANLAKLADVYVKAIDITDEMRAEDDLIDEKYPFVRCESTDEGAMLITDYATTVKNWTIK